MFFFFQVFPYVSPSHTCTALGPQHCHGAHLGGSHGQQAPAYRINQPCRNRGETYGSVWEIFREKLNSLVFFIDVYILHTSTWGGGLY